MSKKNTIADWQQHMGTKVDLFTLVPILIVPNIYMRSFYTKKDADDVKKYTVCVSAV